MIIIWSLLQKSQEVLNIYRLPLDSKHPGEISAALDSGVRRNDNLRYEAIYALEYGKRLVLSRPDKKMDHPGLGGSIVHPSSTSANAGRPTRRTPESRFEAGA